MAGEGSLSHPDKADDHSALGHEVPRCYLRASGPKTEIFRFLDMNLRESRRTVWTTGTEKLLYSFGIGMSNLFFMTNVEL